MEPKLGIDPSLPMALWLAVAQATSQEFADSYLARAKVRRDELWPWTVIAHDRLRASRPAMEAIGRLQYRLRAPWPYTPDRGDPWGAPERAAA